ncbi:hypothetical protein [Serratia sp. Se-RSBMAAmG]|uniref:hypothetical protein n=1 Tax=Serratia sp. Se-RSBMAAmG TaxID=3043305 RepID=UPI0024AFD02B|nr:hypothetical protein [Serratia sp. Se-RSBMAAmG]MDI6977106.1 hypothetical protein [Serratia sp. Se-RSBMAAmG]
MLVLILFAIIIGVLNIFGFTFLSEYVRGIVMMDITAFIIIIGTLCALANMSEEKEKQV